MLYMMDIDGTLIEPFYTGNEKRTVDTPTADYDYERVELIPNVARQLARIQMNDSHACFALITNQGGVAFGYQTVEQVKDKIARVLIALEFFRGSSFSVHYCLSHPEATINLYRDVNDRRRKPGPGMLDEAMQAHRIKDRATACYVGDLPSDEQAAAAAGVAFMYADDFFTSSVQPSSVKTN